jgi:diguanylate cyclase (GGDEF)-like protein
MSGDEAVRATADYLRKELRETDLLVRYTANEFVAVNPRMNRMQAENLKSRLQNDMDHLKFAVRARTELSLRVSIGIAVFPDDGMTIDNLLSAAEWQMREDLDLRSAIRRRIHRFSGSE